MTILGYLMLPLGLAGLLLSTRLLYRFFVFATLFSATSVANFGDAENGSALQVWMFFGALWLLRLSFDHLPAQTFAIDRRIMRPCLWLSAFAAVATASLIMPLYINGALAIRAPLLGDLSETPLYLTAHNFTQLLYLIFGVVIAICVAHVNREEKQIQETEKLILYSGVFVCLWGLFQYGCHLTGFPYPDFLLNNSGSAAGKGFTQTLDGGMARISSVAAEPSMLAQGLITLLPLTMPAWLREGSIVSVRFDRISSFLFLLLLVLSTSSTAYLGLAILFFIGVIVLLRTQVVGFAKASVIVLGALGVIVVLSVAAVSVVPALRDFANSVLFEKSATASGLERVMTVGLAYGYFQRFPVLGIGWGSATSHDLIVKLLSNVGILGAFVFLAAMLSTEMASWKNMDRLATAQDLSRASWFLCLSAFLLTSVLIEFPLAFGNFWLVLGMAIATGRSLPVAHESRFASEPA